MEIGDVTSTARVGHQRGRLGWMGSSMSLEPIAVFAMAALVLAITPGPNMIYLISRSICQGRVAGVLSWCGVVIGLTVHVLCASIGITALFMAVPLGYEALKVGEALYLAWLAWLSVRPGARSPFEARDLRPEPPRKLLLMGLLTSILNPKVAIFYLSILPQFVQPESGSLLVQSLALGAVQILIGSSVNLSVVLSASAIAAWFARNKLWLAVQRYVMGLVLGGLAFKLLAQPREVS